MKTIGLIAAMAVESDALLPYIKGWKKIKLGKLPGICFELAGRNCLLVTSGMGERRAGEAAQSLVENNGVRALITFGIAGAVEKELEIGDVIAAEAVCRLDQGLPGSELPGPLQPLAHWTASAWQAAEQALAGRGKRLLAGTAVTTPGSQVPASRLSGIKHPILEMETMGIARVAAERNVPLFSIRAVSDDPNAPIPFDLAEVMDEDANLRASRMLKAILGHPGILLKTGRLLENTRIAADNAAIVLAAVLNQPDFGA